MVKKNDFGNIAAVILAAGKGERMKSDLPKVLHKVGGRPMIEYVVKTVKNLNIKKIVVVVGHMGQMVTDFLKPYEVECVWQKELLGTGHALLQTKSVLSNFKGTMLVLCGDVPFLSKQTLKELILTYKQTGSSATVLTALLEDPQGYGRIIRSEDGFVEKIVEDKDATPVERMEKEINTGTFCFDSRLIFPALNQVEKENQQGEYYLTDVVKVLRKNNHRVSAFRAKNPKETMGINSLKQLQQMEKLLANGKIKANV
jgi:bifunctional UDP-N-acetylglucosamine pyrophosphorylase/glucosamine-1-phosphate N-acetyltransferase